MPQRVATKSITGEQDDIDCQHEGAYANSKSISKPQRFPNVIGQNKQEKERQIKKIAVRVLHDQRERTLAPIGFSRLTYCACRRISPERFIIGAAIIITRQPESPRRPKNE